MSIQSELNRISSAVGDAYDAVSAKGGTVPASETVANLASAIASIPAGANVRTYSGSAKTGNDGRFTVNCGFQPDMVYALVESYNDGTRTYIYYLCVPLFLQASNDELIASNAYSADVYSDSTFAEMESRKTANGFEAFLLTYDSNFSYDYLRNTTISFTALKWTS